MSSVPGRSREQRRRAVMRSPSLTGLDHVTVERAEADPTEGELWLLHLHFVPPAPGLVKEPVPQGIGPGQVRIHLDGGADPYVRVEELRRGPVAEVLTAVVRRREATGTARRDGAVYLVEIVGAPEVDRFFAAAPFRFVVGRPDGLLLPRLERAAEPRPATDIDYLAKDYESFRQLMLERMAFYVPGWGERNPSDLGVTVVEVLAYVADQLSYFQDAVATEAYLSTARRRISVRRHARLLDFRLQEGTNARVWVQVKVERAGERDLRIDADPGDDRRASPVLRLPAGTQILTSATRVGGVVEEGSEEHARALAEGVLVFETLYPADLEPEHNRFDFYTWGAADYTLPRGTTRAALCGHWPRLAAGDVLLVEKRIGSEGDDATPDPRERQAVRLARPPVLSTDPLTGETVTEIEWFAEDALEADFPVSMVLGTVHHERLSIARGNLVLADHGATVEEFLPEVQEDGPYEPVLTHRGLTYRVPFAAESASRRPAVRAVEQMRWRTLPAIELVEIPPNTAGTDAAAATVAVPPGYPKWRPRFDLLASGRFARDFVVEVDDEGRAHLRFGDGEAGRRPRPGSRFLARYRVGVGPRGNVGVYALRHVVVPPPLASSLAASGLAIAEAKNHRHGEGGDHPRSVEFARVYAPDVLPSFAFQRRAITEEDFAAVAERHPEVHAAVARTSWTGSTALVTLFVQRKGGLALDDAFRERLGEHLLPAVPLGRDLAFREPLFVPLEIEMAVFLVPGAHAEDLVAVFRRETLAPGQRLFAADAFTFGQPVYASALTALAMATPGVADVHLEAFHRWGEPAGEELETGVLPIGPLEIARLANDPEVPQHGTLRVRFVEAL